MTELFELFRYGGEHRLFIFHGVISDATFLNVCTVAAQSGHCEWARQFIRNNQPFLPAAALPDAAALGQGIVLFAQGDYHSACRRLNEVNKSNLPTSSGCGRYTCAACWGCTWKSRAMKRRSAAPPKLSDSSSAAINTCRRSGRQGTHFAKAAKRIALLRTQDWHSSRARAAVLEWMAQLQPLMLGAWLRKQLEG